MCLYCSFPPSFTLALLPSGQSSKMGLGKKKKKK
jgi:hypothetical protein